ncbi:protein kinase domain-containing protein [Schaalia suimastitidis]|uniref:protein kinase domain-containing protein n=1 Tax=Schaalia suimastitidis TaxID=121163 RepID=UPI0003F64CC8|nr:RIO1 family regulatory kinase/ATPase [Schaalia suimastitidis]
MKINSYELGEIVCVARGGPYWATHTSDGREALIQLRSSDEYARYRRRWDRWAQVSHPHVLTLIDISVDADGRVALVTERLSGPSLAYIMDQGSLRRLDEKEALIDALIDGVSVLHSAGIVHADISPTNILMTDSGPVLIDIAEEIGPGGGTPEWSQDLTKDAAGDYLALARIAEAIEAPSCSVERLTRLALSQSSQGDTCKEGVGEAVHSGRKLRRYIPHDYDPIQAMRLSALATPTMPPPRLARHRGTVGRQLALPRLLILGCALVIGVLASGAVALSRGTRPSNEAQSGNVSVSETVIGAEEYPTSVTMSDGASVASCLSIDQANARLEQILSIRDNALSAHDISNLDAALGDDVLAEDLNRIFAMSNENIHIYSYRTTAEAYQVTCSGDGRIAIDAHVQQQAYQRCDNGICRNIAAGPIVPMRLTLGGDTLLLVEAIRQ